MNIIHGFPVKKRRNLSASSVDSILSCPAKFFFESILEMGVSIPSSSSDNVWAGDSFCQ